MSDSPSPSSLRPSRRNLLGSAGVGVAGLALAGAIGRVTEAQAAPTQMDLDILNFALNLEYLEAEFYSRAVFGTGLDPSLLTGTGTFGGVISTPPTPMVTFVDSDLQQYATEIAADEKAHVIYLRSVLGSYAIAEPTIDLGTAFNTLAQAAGIGSSFDPFASETNFLLGSFIFEDVGVTAYHGAAPLITDKSILKSAAGILGVEAYHASEIRVLLTQMGATVPKVFYNAAAISKLRDTLDGPGNDDQGIRIENMLNIVPTDHNALVFARTTTQVLNIVYGNTTTTPGLFFPNGANGVIH